MIRWDEPIEAVHEDGRVVAVRFVRVRRDWPGDTQPYEIAPETDDDASWFREDGGHPYSSWTIRNVAQAPETPHPALSPSEVGPEVQARLYAFVARVAGMPISNNFYVDEQTAIRDEARALLHESVDADLIEARELSAVWCDAIGLDGMARHFRKGDRDQQAIAVHRVVRRALEKEAGR